LAVERLEDRSLPSVSPIPIPGGVLVPNPLGDPDVHFHSPGPADSGTPNAVGGDPSSLYDFNGFVGVAHVQGTAVRIWDLSTGRERICLRGHADSAYSLAYSPDGRFLASGSSDGTVRIWDADAPTPTQE
jgi:WD40 repeat protein